MSFFNGVNRQTVSEAPDGFKEFKIGDNHACISKVEEKVSTNNNLMLKITFVDDDGASIFYWIVDGKHKLSRLKQLYQAFGIPMGETDTDKWVGKWGCVVCKAGEPNAEGKVYNKVSFLRPIFNNKQQDSTPKQQAPRNESAPQEQTNDFNEFTDDIPF
jgi:hypothetical protein